MWMKQLVALLGLSVINCISAQLVDNFVCPDEFEGYYPHLYSCDRYWKCIDGRESLETCGNQLHFFQLKKKSPLYAIYIYYLFLPNS